MEILRKGTETVPFGKISTPRNQVKLRYFSKCTFMVLVKLLLLPAKLKIVMLRKPAGF